MDGEFVCEETFETTKGVAGGNLIVLGRDGRSGLAATERAVEVMRKVAGVILPFPGGIARSGSKVGSKYKALRASTNTAFAPTLRGVVESQMPMEAGCAYEVVIDGLTLEAVERATAVGVRAAVGCEGVVGITAGNYGGKLGPFHIRLREVVERWAGRS
jgi:formylmethanofuran--tetrahydromethanopterin N-formyltransferase